MGSIQDQVNVLSIKVDALHSVTEEFSNKILATLSELQSMTKLADVQPRLLHQDGELLQDGVSYSYQRFNTLASVTEHKDVLADSNYPRSELGADADLSPELQIRRLTAQLTAAYNRIAALEEQLLSKRVHSQVPTRSENR